MFQGKDIARRWNTHFAYRNHIIPTLVPAARVGKDLCLRLQGVLPITATIWTSGQCNVLVQAG